MLCSVIVVRLKLYSAQCQSIHPSIIVNEKRYAIRIWVTFKAIMWEPVSCKKRDYYWICCYCRRPNKWRSPFDHRAYAITMGWNFSWNCFEFHLSQMFRQNMAWHHFCFLLSNLAPKAESFYNVKYWNVNYHVKCSSEDCWFLARYFFLVIWNVSQINVFKTILDNM